MFKKYLCLFMFLCTAVYALEPTINYEYFTADDVTPPELVRTPGTSLTMIVLENWPANMVLNVKSTRDLTDVSNSFILMTNEIGTGMTAVESIGYFPGEPVTFEFSTQDRSVIKSMKLNPHRILSKKADGTSVSAEIVEVRPYSFKMIFEGFEPGEEYIYKMRSGDTNFQQKMNYDPKNLFIVSPANESKGGIAKVEIERCKNGEKYKLSMPWGFEVLKYSMYYDKGKACLTIDDPTFQRARPDVAEYFAQKKLRGEKI